MAPLGAAVSPPPWHSPIASRTRQSDALEMIMTSMAAGSPCVASIAKTSMRGWCSKDWQSLIATIPSRISAKKGPRVQRAAVYGLGGLTCRGSGGRHTSEVPSRRYRLLSIDHTAGEAIVIGYDAKDVNTLIVAIGAQFTEMDVANCFLTGQGERTLGESARRHYMKLHPGKLK